MNILVSMNYPGCCPICLHTQNEGPSTETGKHRSLPYEELRCYFLPCYIRSGAGCPHLLTLGQYDDGVLVTFLVQNKAAADGLDVFCILFPIKALPYGFSGIDGCFVFSV